MKARPEVGPFNLRPLSEPQQLFSHPPAHADLHLSTFWQAVFRIPNCFPSYVLHANSYGSGAAASCRGLAQIRDHALQRIRLYRGLPQDHRHTPRRTVLSTTEREGLLAFPGSTDECIRLYTFNESDLALIGGAPWRRRAVVEGPRPWMA